MSVAIADQQVDKETAEKARDVNLGADGMLLDGARYVFIGGVIFAGEVPSPGLVQDLREIFQAQLAAVSLAIETGDDERGFVDDSDGAESKFVDFLLADEFRTPAKA